MNLALRSKRVAAADKVVQLIATAGVLAVVGGMAMAGTDTTFGTISQRIVDWLGGSLGLTLAGVSLLFGIGSAVIRFDWKMFAASIGVALAATLGPGILGSLVSAII